MLGVFNTSSSFGWMISLNVPTSGWPLGPLPQVYDALLVKRVFAVFLLKFTGVDIAHRRTSSPCTGLTNADNVSPLDWFRLPFNCSINVGMLGSVQKASWETGVTTRKPLAAINTLCQYGVPFGKRVKYRMASWLPVWPQPETYKA